MAEFGSKEWVDGVLTTCIMKALEGEKLKPVERAFIETKLREVPSPERERLLQFFGLGGVGA